MARSGQEGAIRTFLYAEAKGGVESFDDGIGQLAQLSGGYLSTLGYMGRIEGNEVGCGYQGLVERRQQVLESGGVEVGQDVQQIRHGEGGRGHWMHLGVGRRAVDRGRDGRQALTNAGCRVGKSLFRSSARPADVTAAWPGPGPVTGDP